MINSRYIIKNSVSSLTANREALAGFRSGSGVSARHSAWAVPNKSHSGLSHGNSRNAFSSRCGSAGARSPLSLQRPGNKPVLQVSSSTEMHGWNISFICLFKNNSETVVI